MRCCSDNHFNNLELPYTAGSAFPYPRELYCAFRLSLAGDAFPPFIIIKCQARSTNNWPWSCPRPTATPDRYQ